jgi:hypothetical protein
MYKLFSKAGINIPKEKWEIEGNLSRRMKGWFIVFVLGLPIV